MAAGGAQNLDAALAVAARDGSRGLRLAIAALRRALQADPAAEPTLGMLAAAAGTSPRSLQRQFARVLGLSPLALGRLVRLASARQTLVNGQVASVLEAALRHGFDHPGRFAIVYAKSFGESPGATLRAARAARRPALASSRIPPAIAIVLRPLRAVGACDAADAARATDALAMALRRQPGFLLVSADGAAGGPQRPRYAVHGRVDSGTILLDLVAAASASMLWTGRVGTTARPRPAWADRAAWRLRTAIDATELADARRMPRRLASPEALLLRARAAAATLDRDAVAIALDLAQEALARDPAHAQAHALTGWSLGKSAIHHFNRDVAGTLDAALGHAERALSLAPDDPEVLTRAAAVMAFDGRYDQAERLARTSLALAPDQPDAWLRLAWIHNYRGQWLQGGETFRRSLRRWPDHANRGSAMIGIGLSRFACGDYAAAARALTRALEIMPSYAWANRYRCPAALLAGCTGHARQSLEALRRSVPELRLRDITDVDIMKGEAQARMLDGLAQVGLPA